MEQLTQTFPTWSESCSASLASSAWDSSCLGHTSILTASGAPQQMERGKSAMMTALAGIILAMVAYGVVDLVMNAVVDPAVSPDLPDPTPEGGTETTTEGG